MTVYYGLYHGNIFIYFHAFQYAETKICKILESNEIHNENISTKYTAQKMMFAAKDFFSKCDQIRSFL